MTKKAFDLFCLAGPDHDKALQTGTLLWQSRQIDVQAKDENKQRCSRM